MVNEVPGDADIISGPTTVCKGQTNVLYSIPISDGADTYQWEYPDGSNEVIKSNEVILDFDDNSVSGFIHVTPQNDCGNGNRSSLFIQVSSPPISFITTSGSTAFCSGDSVVLSVTEDPDLEYHWKRDGGIVGINHYSFTAYASGSYTLEVSNSSGCTVSSSNTLEVIVTEVPTIPTVNVSGETAFCHGQSVELSVEDNPGLTYQWMDDNFALAGEVSNSYTATTTGNYKLRITNAEDCPSETKEVEVIADPAPTAPTIQYTGSTEFCDTDSITLFVSDNPFYTYEWLLNGGNVGADQNIYTARSSGTYTVRIINRGGCSTSSVNEVDVIVYSSPEPPTISLSGPTEFCADQSVTLSVVEAGTLEYQWIVDSGLIPGETLPSITIRESGGYKVRARNEKICESYSQEIITMAKPYPIAPVILSENYESGACQGEDPITLRVENPEGNVQYQWKRNGVDISKANSDTFIDHLSEADYVVEAILHGCGTASQPLTIVYGEMPEKPEIIVHGPVVWYLVCTNDQATEYRWYWNEERIEGANEIIYVAGSQKGKYEVAIAEGSSCFARSDPTYIPLVTGIDSRIWENLKIYPNPTPGLFTLEMDNLVMGELIIDIFLETGQQIINIKFEKEITRFKTQIDLSGQPAGVYLIGIALEQYRAIKTLVVE